jgi:predicted ester cyclase
VSPMSSLLFAILFLARIISGEPQTPQPLTGETIARRYFDEVWNQGKVDVLDELLVPDYINHTPSTGHPPPGPNGLKPIVQAIRRAFPDLHYTIEDIVVGADTIAIRTTMTGTHEGDLFGIAPTHRRVKVMQIQIERIKNGRIVEHWRVTDDLTLMRQLGVVQ